MPIGTITMSDGRSGSVLHTDPTPSALVRPYDGGPAFANPHVTTTRFSHMPTVTGQPHLQDKVRIETVAEPPAISVRNTIGTTRVGARGKKKQYHGSAEQHVSGALGGSTLSSFLAVQANEQPEPRCIAGSNRKRYDWDESYGLRSAETLPRGKAMNSINGRSVYARDQYSVPRKKVVEQPDRQPKKGPSAHLVTLANGGETEDLGRRHYDQSNPPNRVPDVKAQRGKFADFPIKPTTESDPRMTGKMGEYSVFDMIGRKRADPGKWSENANHWPATKGYGPSHDPEGFPIDYSITENGGPFRRPTIYHNDYRLEKQSTYGKVLPPGHSERFPPGTSDSVIRAQQIPQTTNLKPALGTPLVGVAPGLTDLGATAPAALAAPSSMSSARSQPPPLAERLQPKGSSRLSTGNSSDTARVRSSDGLIIPEIYFGSENKSYNKGASYTHSCATRAGTPPTQQAPRAEVVRYKATEDGNHRKRATHTGIFRP